MSIFFALLPRHRVLPPIRRWTWLACLLAGASACGRAAEPAPKLAESGVAIVPADAAFLSATLRAREQFDRLVHSNAFAALKELPAVKRALGSLEEQRSMPGSPFSLIDTFMELPENEQAAQLLADMVATDTFVYGDPSCVALLKLFQKLQERQSAAPLQAEADDDDDVSIEDAQKAAILEGLAANLDLVVVPDIVWGFRTTMPDAAKSQLKRIEVLLKLVTQANPDLADALSRRKVAGGEVVTFTVSGEQLPWSQLEDELAENLGAAVDAADLEKVLGRLKQLDLVIAVGLVGDRVILSIGDAVDHLEKLALPGSGKRGLLGTRPFEPLLAHKDKPLTGISYVSGDLAGLGNPVGQVDSLARMIDQVAEQGDVPPAMAADIRKFVDTAGRTFTKRLPIPGPWMAFSFFSDQGYEGYAWDWTRNQPWDGSRRLDLLEHVGGAPLAVVVSRMKSDPALLDELAALAAGGWSLFKKHGLSAIDADDRGAVEAFDEHVAPLGTKLLDVVRKKLVPSLADGQVGLVLDAKGKTERLQADLPASADPLPVIEPAIVLPLDDPKLFREGLSDLFALSDELVVALREMDADGIPEGYRVPEPEKAKVEAGSVWSFPLAKSGLDEQFRPAIGVGAETAVFSLAPKQAGRLLAGARLETGSQLSTFQEPLAGAATLDFAGLVDALKPWVVYLTRYGCVQQRDGVVDADEPLTAEDETPEAKEALAHIAVALEAAKCLRAAVSEMTTTEEATVTHWRNVIRDMPPRK
jgi:hypothetical protein